MRRIAFNTAATLSLLLCLWLLYSWLRSFVPSPLRLEPIDGSLMIMWWEGTVPSDSQYDIFNPNAEGKFYGIRGVIRNIKSKTDKQWLGFRYLSGGGTYRGMVYHIVGIPFWILIPPTAVLPALWFYLRRRQHDRVKFGHCLACGYDLRESKDKCPECGAAVSAAVH